MKVSGPAKALYRSKAIDGDVFVVGRAYHDGVYVQIRQQDGKKYEMSMSIDEARSLISRLQRYVDGAGDLRLPAHDGIAQI